MATNIKARRRLSDLFMEGVEVRFGLDENGKRYGKIGPFDEPASEDEVAMFVRPPDPLQREQAMREGQAKRARAIVRAKRDEDSEEHLTIMAFLADMDDEMLIDYVVLGDTAERRAEAEREILAMDEWKDMLSYQDAMRQFAEMEPEELENNEEWEALVELDEKYGQQLAEREKQLMEAQVEVLRMLDRSQVERKALERRAELLASQAFINEYERQMRFHSVREADNPNVLFFADPDDFAAQPDLVRDTLGEALLPFITDAGEAKNLQGAAPGSDSSVPPSELATSESSTPEERSA